MQGNSRQVSSNQPGPHPRLAEVVRRHLDNPERGPLADHDLRAFGELHGRLQREPRPLLLDSFCGTGHSTAGLAARFPEYLAVGIDKSAARLAKAPTDVPDNCLLLRADCGAIWRQLAAEHIRADRHYLFYPNPWPKARQLQRRVHGHASFPWLLALGGEVELRSNWQLYVEEFGIAVHVAGRRGVVRRVEDDEPPASPFETKYRASGHTLWTYRCRDELPAMV